MIPSPAIKRIAALVLAVSFFLPLSQCSDKREGAPQSHVQVYEITAFTAYKWPSFGSTIAVFLFFWPIALCSLESLGLAGFLAQHKLKVELVLTFLTLAGVVWLTLWGKSIRYGAFVAVGSILAYAAAAVAGNDGSGNSNNSL